MTCLHCNHWRMKRSPLIRHGFGQCAMTAATSTAPDHVCAKFSPAPEKVTAPRVEWFQKLGATAQPGPPEPPAVDEP